MKNSNEIYNNEHPVLYKKILATILIFLMGALAFGAARFILVKKQHTHYHANFALYINGVRDEFKSFVYYEEVTACSDKQQNNPKSRVHMHDNKNDLVHVHDVAVTWSHFFDNLGYTFADGLLVTPKGIYQNSTDAKFSYILNGKKISNVAGNVIGSGDTLLINYGTENENVVMDRYNAISRNAVEYNDKPDPSSCSGDENEPISDRLVRTLFR